MLTEALEGRKEGDSGREEVVVRPSDNVLLLSPSLSCGLMVFGRPMMIRVKLAEKGKFKRACEVAVAAQTKRGRETVHVGRARMDGWTVGRMSGLS